MTTTPSPFVQRMAAEFAAFLERYIDWNDRYDAAEAAARAKVEAAGGRIFTGGQDGMWGDDGTCTETYYVVGTGEEIARYTHRSGEGAENGTPVYPPKFHDGDVHEDHLMDDHEDLAHEVIPDPFGFREWADEQDIDDLRAQLAE